MNFLSWSFAGFIAAFVIVYYCIPARYRYILLLAGSFIFYGSNDWHYLPILVGVILISYAGGMVLFRHKKRLIYLLFFAADLGVLAFFKYTNFFISNWVIIPGWRSHPFR